MYYFLALFVVVILILLWTQIRAQNYWCSRNVPQERPLLFFGNFANVVFKKENIGALTQKFCEQFKRPYYGLTIFNKHILVLNDPELIKTVLLDDFEKFPSRSVANFESADPIMYRSLFAVPNSKWRTLRSKLAPIFSTGNMKNIVPTTIKCAKNMVNNIERNSTKTIDFKEVCSKYATDVISSCFFGIRVNSFDIDHPEFYLSGRKIFEDKFSKSFSQFCYFFMPLLMPIFGMKFIDGSAARFLKTTYLEVAQKRIDHDIKNNGDFFEHFIKLEDDSDLVNLFKLGDVSDLMVSQAINFFIAGVGSMGCLICFALYELALNGSIQERLRKEIGDREITYEDINGLPYLDMVIRETLRMYIFAPLITRVSSEDYIFKKTGLKIDKGTPVAISIRGIHYNSDFFLNPHKFDPERFNKTNKTKIVPYTYLALGEGPRNCIGARFAVLSAKVALVSILKNFVIEPSPLTENPIKLSKTSSFTVPQNGIPLNVRKIHTEQ